MMTEEEYPDFDPFVELTEEELVEDLLEDIAVEEHQGDKPWLKARAALTEYNVLHGPQSQQYLDALLADLKRRNAAGHEPGPPESPADND